LAEVNEKARIHDRVLLDFGSPIRPSEPSPEDIAGCHELIAAYCADPQDSFFWQIADTKAVLLRISAEALSGLFDSPFILRAGEFLEDDATYHHILDLIESTIGPRSPFEEWYVSMNIVTKMCDKFHSTTMAEDAISGFRLILKLPTASNEQLRRQFHENLDRVIQGVVDGLHAWPSGDAFDLGLQALVAILRLPEPRSGFVFQVQNFILGLIKSPFSPETLTSVFKCFTAMLLNAKGLTRRYGTTDQMAHLLGLLERSDGQLRVEILRAMEVLTAGRYAEPGDVLLANGLLGILRGLPVDGPEFVSVLTIVSNVAFTGGPDICEQIVEAGYLEFVERAIECGSMLEMASAAFLISNLMYKGAFGVVERVAQPPFLPFLVSMLEDADVAHAEVFIDGFIRALRAEAEAGADALKAALTQPEIEAVVQEFTERPELHALCEELMTTLAE
jgi:hypothetical protein